MGIWQNGVKQEVQEYMRFCHETFGPGAEFSEKIGLLEPFFFLIATFLKVQLLKGAFPHFKAQSCRSQTVSISREALNLFNV